jgi:hypothetical protein
VREPSKEQIKERAKFLRQVLREKHNIELPHGHSLEVLAKVFGFNDWNTASALSSNAETETPADVKLAAKPNDPKPSIAKFQTTGELREFLSKFDDSTKLIVNEYGWCDPNSNNPLAGNITSVCSLTFDGEIQSESELILELNTEEERNDSHVGGSRSATQSFDQTPAGRSQRRIKFLEHFNFGSWNPNSKIWPARKT